MGGFGGFGVRGLWVFGGLEVFLGFFWGGDRGCGTWRFGDSGATQCPGLANLTQTPLKNQPCSWETPKPTQKITPRIGGPQNPPRAPPQGAPSIWDGARPRPPDPQSIPWIVPKSIPRPQIPSKPHRHPEPHPKPTPLVVFSPFFLPFFPLFPLAPLPGTAPTAVSTFEGATLVGKSKKAPGQ